MRTSGAAVVDVGGREVMTVGTWLSGLPVAVEGWATTDDFTTEENVNVGFALPASPVAGFVAGTAVVAAASVDESRETVDEGKKSNVGMVLPSTADVADELEMLLAIAV